MPPQVRDPPCRPRNVPTCTGDVTTRWHQILIYRITHLLLLLLHTTRCRCQEGSTLCRGQEADAPDDGRGLVTVLSLLTGRWVHPLPRGSPTAVLPANVTIFRGGWVSPSHVPTQDRSLSRCFSHCLWVVGLQCQLLLGFGVSYAARARGLTLLLYRLFGYLRSRQVRVS